MLMKKFLLSLAMILSVAFTASAKEELNIELSYFWATGSREGNVVTFIKEWDGLAFWMDSKKGIAKIVVEYEEPTTILTQLLVQFNDIKDVSNQAPAGSTSLEVELTEGDIKQFAIQNAEPGVIKVKSVTLYTAEDLAGGSTDPEPTPGANHVLKLTQDAAKANPWDTQVFINIKNLKEGEKYTIEFDVLGGAEFTLGTETIDDAQTEHMTEWNASAVFNYTEEVNVTTSWAKGIVTAPGVTDVNCHSHCTPKTEGGSISHASGSTSSCNVAVHEKTTYAATAILLNVGKTVGELCIDNVVVKDGEGNVVYTEDFENAKVAADNKTATAYFPGWQGAKWSIVEMDAPSSLGSIEAAEAVAPAYDLFGNPGATKGFMVKGGKKVYVK